MSIESKDFLAGFLMGAAIGAVVGIAYAPKSGRETRALLKEKAEEVAEKARETAEKAMEAAEKATQNVLAVERKLEKKLGK
ncbi:MAG: YtxH domain-containing protein [Asgard group archaeon]|nr:YtxH domain-containing protein [Asgard group archaeon]